MAGLNLKIKWIAFVSLKHHQMIGKHSIWETSSSKTLAALNLLRYFPLEYLYVDILRLSISNNWKVNVFLNGIGTSICCSLRLLSSFQQVNSTLFSFSPDLHSHMHLYKISRNVVTVSWDRDIKGKRFYFQLKEYFYCFFSKNLVYLWQSCIWHVFIMSC